MDTDDYLSLDTKPITVRGILNKVGLVVIKMYNESPPVLYRGDRLLPIYGRGDFGQAPEGGRHLDFGGHYNFYNKRVTDEDTTQEQLNKRLEERLDAILEVLTQRQEQTTAVWGAAGMPGVVTKSRRVVVLYRVGQLHPIDDIIGGGFDIRLLDMDETELPESTQEIKAKATEIRKLLPQRVA